MRGNKVLNKKIIALENQRGKVTEMVLQRISEKKPLTDGELLKENSRLEEMEQDFKMATDKYK